MQFGRQHTLALSLALLLLVGCDGGPEIASVEGTVTMDGQPLPYASVVFYNQNSRPAGASTDENGSYVLTFSKGRQGAMPGRSIVRISTIRDGGSDVNGMPTPGSKETVPMRYNAQTELEFDVQAGQKNIADFHLTSDGTVLKSSDY